MTEMKNINENKLRLCIIGGGPAGLVTLKTALEAQRRFGVEMHVRLFEAEEKIGGVFSYRVWDEAEVRLFSLSFSFSFFVPSSLLALSVYSTLSIYRLKQALREK